MSKKSKIKQYFWNILIGLDQWVNTWFGGDPDEEKDHFAKSIEEDEGSNATLDD